MSQTMVQGTASSLLEHGGMTWASPGVDLWVASRRDAGGVHFLGFVERSLDDFIAVDGEGASLGRHADLESAKRAVRVAHEPAVPARWSDTGALVLTVRALRAR